MICKNCGKDIADDSLECEYCGAKQLVEENTENNNNAENDNTNEVKSQSVDTQPSYYAQQTGTSALVNNSDERIFKIKVIICAVGMLMGVLLLFSGFTGLGLFFGKNFSGYGSYPDSAVFGADFYTEIHDAVRNAAYNTNKIIDMLGSCLKTFDIAFGSFMLLINSFVLCLIIEKRNR